jgi:hypothetical protein
MRKRRILVSVATVLGLAGAGVAVTAGTASAAGYNGACGSGYTVIDSMTVGYQNVQGTSYLTYNRNNGYNCVVTVAGTSGTNYIVADLEVSGGTWVEDAGPYHSYAGPVYVYAADKCVDWGGFTSADGHAYVVDLQWNDHCG